MFYRWSENKPAVQHGCQPAPMELLLLGCLRYLGRGWSFDDLEEVTGISEETHRKFLHLFLIWGSSYFFDKYVIAYDGDELQQNSKEYEMAGFAGCVGSGDATHIGMLKCYYKLSQYHNSPKLNMPSRTYNIFVNHRRRILSTTSGHPGQWNDKTLIFYDSFATEMRNGQRCAELSFTLNEKKGDVIVSVNYIGAWTIVDNGYLPWPTLIPPIKLPTSYAEMRFSRWLESMRKDVECTFGIMKGRFRILKTGIPMHGIEVCDRVWKTCCALHNFLLEEDGLDIGWDVNRYLGEEGNHEECDL